MRSWQMKDEAIVLYNSTAKKEEVDDHLLLWDQWNIPRAYVIAETTLNEWSIGNLQYSDTEFYKAEEERSFWLSPQFAPTVCFVYH